MEANWINFIDHGDQHYMCDLIICNVIFGYHDKELKVLLQRPSGSPSWTLPVGFMKRTETLEEAAASVVKRRTGLDKLFLNQFKLFNSCSQYLDANINADSFYKTTGRQIPKDHWMFKPKIAVGFYTLTEFSKVTVHESGFFTDCQWWDIDRLPALLFDPGHVIDEARKSLCKHLYFYPIGYELLEEKFTYPEIHHLYERLLDRKLDERNFLKKLLSMNIIIKLKEQKKIGPHRSPYLYSFNREVYQKAIEEGVSLL